MQIGILSYDVTSGSDITPCIKIDYKPLLVTLCHEGHSNIAFIITKFNCFHAKIPFQSRFSVSYDTGKKNLTFMLLHVNLLNLLQKSDKMLGKPCI